MPTVPYEGQIILSAKKGRLSILIDLMGPLLKIRALPIHREKEKPKGLYT